MALEVIGAGFGRTGTLSLKVALEQLGLGPCHHMLEVMGKPDAIAAWRRAAAGEEMDWEAVFDGYRATVDWPSAAFWRPLAKRYPDAPVVLTLRDPDRWYDSIAVTILQVLQREPPADAPDWLAEQLAMVHEIVSSTFDDRLDDRDHAIAVYQRHNAEVQREIAGDRLLVFEVAQGWEPLCRFLGRPVPGTPFPRLNDSEEFQARMRAMPR